MALTDADRLHMVSIALMRHNVIQQSTVVSRMFQVSDVAQTIRTDLEDLSLSGAYYTVTAL